MNRALNRFKMPVQALEPGLEPVHVPVHGYELAFQLMFLFWLEHWRGQIHY